MPKIIIPGKPRPQVRHRAVRRGKFIQMYDPMSKYKQELSKLADGHTMLDTGPIAIELRFYMKLPASCRRSERMRLIGTPVTKKPDIDNLAKMVFDTFSGILYLDDSQITSLTATKVYDENPRTEFTWEKI